MEQKKYTKQQIKNAIDYWTRKLNVLNESKAKVIDDLISKFKEDVVLSKEENFSPNTQDLRDIYDILNTNLFNGELKNIPITYCNSRSFADRVNTYITASNSNEQQADDISSIGAHLAVTKEQKNENGIIEKITFSNNVIVLNSDYIKKNIFIFIVACLCQEMIHYCDSFSDEMHNKFLKQELDPNYSFDAHKNSIFQTKMSEANENGINVEETLSLRLDKDAYKARLTLKNVFGEEESRETTVKQFNNMLIVKNKKTGIGFFAQFD